MKIKNTNLWFSDNFKSYILSEANKLPIFRVYEKNILPRNMTDAEIQKEWNIKPYSVPEFLSLITFLIKKQPKGEEGVLNNWKSNIFYVRTDKSGVVAVDVNCYGDDCEWSFSANSLDDVRWSAGFCVFSRSADLTLSSSTPILSNTFSLKKRIEKLEKFKKDVKKILRL